MLKWIESLSKPDLATSSEGDDEYFYDIDDEYDYDDVGDHDETRLRNKSPVTPAQQQHLTHTILQSDDYFRGCPSQGH